MSRRDDQSSVRTIPKQDVLLGALCGAAIWTTLGVLDANGPSADPVRVALLPAWRLLAMLVAAGGIVAGWLGTRLRRAAVRLDPGSTAEAAGNVLRPLAGTALLLLPYLPWLPDRLPILMALAGSLRWLVWGLVVAQVALGAWRLVTPRRLPRTDARAWRLATLAVIVCAIGSIVAARRLTDTVAYPGGDEPHYLVMAQSLWRDGDLRIENNHARGDYLEYFDRQDLHPDYLTRGVDGEIYSVHPVGLPLLLAPIYAAGGYAGVLAGLIGIAAATGGVMIWWMRRLGLAAGAAGWAWLAVGASAPFLLHSFAVYPETAGGLCVTLTLALVTTAPARLGRWAAAGLAAALLPWLSTKYAPMAAVAIAVGLGRIWIGSTAERGARLRASAALLGPFGLGGLAWLAFFWIYWGTPSPSAPYGNGPSTALHYLLAGAPGLIFDQEYGILVCAPVLALGLLGLGAMARDGGAGRRQAIEIGATLAALLATVGAFHLWWGGSSPPGRPVVSGLALLAVPIAWLVHRDRERSLRTALYRLLLVVSLGFSAMLVFLQDGNLVVNGRDGTSTLIEYLSPLWPATALAPSFITQPPPAASLVVLLWLGLATAIGLSRRPIRWVCRRGGAPLTATALATVTIVAGSIVVPRLPGASGQAAADLEMRRAFDVLRRFDAGLRPLGVVYDPARLVPAGTLVRRFVFRVEPPSIAPDPTALHLLYERRLSLPAGRYRVELAAGPSAVLPGDGTLALQLGRFGSPAVRWPIRAAAGTWSRQFEVATDVAFAGLLASPELELAEPRVRLVPLRIVDASNRPQGLEVQSARFYREGAILFVDTNVFQEPSGFWIRKARSASFLVAVGTGPQAPIRLHTHCGPVANELRVTSGPVDRQLSYRPGTGAFEIDIPAPVGRAMVEVAVSSGFVPSERDPDDRDRRELGCWVEMDGWTPPPSGADVERLNQ